MGFLFHAIKLPGAISADFFLNILANATLFFIGALSYLGLYKPPPEESPNSTPNSSNYILILDSSSPSLVPIPVQVVTAAIKTRLPILQFQDLIGVEEQLKVCSICLECIEARDEVRELCNCSHLFHRECLDTWIDEGQVNCPLCRSMMLPPKVNLVKCNGVMQTNAHLLNTL